MNTASSTQPFVHTGLTCDVCGVHVVERFHCEIINEKMIDMRLSDSPSDRCVKKDKNRWNKR